MKILVKAGGTYIPSNSSSTARDFKTDSIGTCSENRTCIRCADECKPGSYNKKCAVGQVCCNNTSCGYMCGTVL